MPAIATDVIVAWSVRLSHRLSHSCTQLVSLDRKWYHLARHSYGGPL